MASKTENYQTEIKDILQIANPPDRSVIIALEFVLCQVLKFDLKVRHPFLPLHGLYLELIDYLKGDSKGDTPPAEGSTPLPSLSAAYAKAKQNADHLMSTDAQLLFTPAQLAWTCLRAGMKDTGMSEDWDGFIEKRLGVEDDGRRRLLESRMDEAAGYLKLKLELTPPEAGKLREKLAKCANPLKDPNSAVAKARKEEAAKREEERRKAKREKETTKHAALSDVFS